MHQVIVFNRRLNIASGDNDFLKPYGEELLKSFVDPVVIRHPKGHTVPRLGMITNLNFQEIV